MIPSDVSGCGNKLIPSDVSGCGNKPIRAGSGYIAGDVRLNALLKGKQDLGFVGLDEYIMPGSDTGTLPEKKLNLLTAYLINKVSAGGHVYYLSGEGSESLEYTCPDGGVDKNQALIDKDTGRFSFKAGAGGGDHSSLRNLDYEHSGHTGFAGILLGTTAYWASMPEYVPPSGMLVVYTDYAMDEQGRQVSNFKIGDGNAHLIDKPFLGDDVRDALNEHIADASAHVSAADRARWDGKLNYDEPVGDLLIFTRD